MSEHTLVSAYCWPASSVTDHLCHLTLSAVKLQPLQIKFVISGYLQDAEKNQFTLYDLAYMELEIATCHSRPVSTQHRRLAGIASPPVSKPNDNTQGAQLLPSPVPHRLTKEKKKKNYLGTRGLDLS